MLYEIAQKEFNFYDMDLEWIVKIWDTKDLYDL